MEFDKFSFWAFLGCVRIKLETSSSLSGLLIPLKFWFCLQWDSPAVTNSEDSTHTCKGECGVSCSLTHWRARLTSEAEIRGAQENIPSAVQEKSRQHGSKRYETVSFWVGSYTICRWKGFTEVSSNIPKQRSEIRKASKRCLETEARKCKEGTSTSRKGRGGAWSSARARNKGKSAFRLQKLHQNARWKQLRTGSPSTSGVSAPVM